MLKKTLRLTLDVTYDHLHTESLKELGRKLVMGINHLSENGMLTGDMETTVHTWVAEVHAITPVTERTRGLVG